MVAIYYSILSAIFFFLPSQFKDSSTMTGDITENINSSGFEESEIDVGFLGVLINVGLTVARFIGFLAFGLGLPTGTPFFIQYGFSAWQIILNLIIIFTIKNAFWKG